MKIDTLQGKNRAGGAIVELALLMPVLLILLLGCWEVGRMVQINQILNNAAREGARVASTGLNTYSDVNTVVNNYLTTAGISNVNKLQVQVVNVTQNAGPKYDPSQAKQLDQLQVTVLLPFSNVRWNLLYLVTNANTQLTAQAIWCSNQNQAYPGNVVAPPGW
jgi:Flp pilus assembly protein TadG